MFIPNQTPLPFDFHQPQAAPPRDRGLLPLFKIVAIGILTYSSSVAIGLVAIVFPALFWFCLMLSLSTIVFLAVQAYWGHDGKYLALSMLSLFATLITHFA
jgi:hypothetical protein